MYILGGDAGRASLLWPRWRQTGDQRRHQIRATHSACRLRAWYDCPCRDFNALASLPNVPIVGMIRLQQVQR